MGSVYMVVCEYGRKELITFGSSKNDNPTEHIKDVLGKCNGMEYACVAYYISEYSQCTKIEKDLHASFKNTAWDVPGNPSQTHYDSPNYPYAPFEKVIIAYEKRPIEHVRCSVCTHHCRLYSLIKKE